MNEPTPGQDARVAVWDLPLRLFHWALAVSVITSIVAVEVLDDIELHLQSGQVVIGLLVFRLIWGVIGSSTAQFHRFIKGPAKVVATIKGREPQEPGHNPLGALSVIAMLLSLLVQVLTGLGSDDEIFTTGPLVKYMTGEQVSWANRIHDWNSKLLFVLIALHLAAIAFYWFKKKRNLVWPMVVGWMNGNFPVKVRFSPLWLAALVAAFGGWVAWWVFRL